MSGFDGTAGLIALGAASLTAFATDLPSWLAIPVAVFVYGVVQIDHSMADRSSNHGERLNSINNRLNSLNNHYHHLPVTNEDGTTTSVPRYVEERPIPHGLF